MNNYYIYTLTDPIDGEIKYIGKSKNMKNRLWNHMSPHSLKKSWTPKNKWLLWLRNQKLKPIMEVLDEGEENNIDLLEEYWISQFKSWGFKLKNVASGGKGYSYWAGKKMPAYSILKTKMNNPLRKVVCEYEIGTNILIKEYDSINDASKDTKHKKDTIVNSCKGRSIPHKFGYYWRFKDNYFPYVERDLKHTPEDLLKMKMNYPTRKTICQYEIGTDKLMKEWDSSKEIERETGINHGHVNKCCKGIENYNSAGGYYWRFKNNYFPYEAPSNSPVKIEQYDENWNLIKIYKSTYELKKDNFNYRVIEKNIKDKYKDYYWKIIRYEK